MRRVAALMLAMLPSCREPDATPATSSASLPSASLPSASLPSAPPATTRATEPSAAAAGAGSERPATAAVDAGASADGGAGSDAGVGNDVCLAAWQAAEEGRCAEARHAYWRCTQEPHGGKSDTAQAARAGILYRCQKR